MTEALSLLFQISQISSYHRDVLMKHHDAAIDVVRAIVSGVRFQSQMSRYDFKRLFFSSNMRHYYIKKTVNSQSSLLSKSKDLSFLPGGLNCDGFWLVVSSLVSSGYLKAQEISQSNADTFAPVHFVLEPTPKSQELAEQELSPDVFVMTRAFIDDADKEWKPEFKELKKDAAKVIRHFGYSDIIYRARSVMGEIIPLECVDDSGRQMMTDGVTTKTLTSNPLFSYEERQASVHSYYHVFHPSQIAKQAASREVLSDGEMSDWVVDTACKLDEVNVVLGRSRQERQAIRDQIKALQKTLDDTQGDAVSKANAIINR